MAGRRSLNADKIIEDLRKEIRDLKSSNNKLSESLKKMESVGRRPSQMIASAVNRSRRRQLAAEKLENANVWVIVGWWLMLFCSLAMVLSISSSIIIRTVARNSTIGSLSTEYLSELASSKVSSMAAGFLGIIIAAIGQRVFPAPWRTFCAVLAFSIKQIVDLFLPDYCAFLLILFGFLVILTIDYDRKRQIEIERRAIVADIK